MSSITGSGTSPGEGHGKTLQYSCLENPMDREAIVHRVSKSRTRLKRLGAHTHAHIHMYTHTYTYMCVYMYIYI